jgi:hypothetical protein
MTTHQIKRTIGLLLLGAFLAYFAHKLFATVDSNLLAILILAMVVFVAILGWYVIRG